MSVSPVKPCKVVQKQDGNSMQGKCVKTRVGGLTELKPADAEILAITIEVKDAVEEKVGKKLETYSPVSYKTQVVAGINYFVKVNVGDEYLHLRIFAPLPCTGNPKELTDLQTGKTAEDEIIYF
uniref:Cystatin-A-like isoform X2 n=1 Tax=Crassostrea virginica TaxID=6565 RepID=A0A8B8BN39_CRAVI|nr:cystatin-A-like isoform X2 [Crassostrea virginica]